MDTYANQIYFQNSEGNEMTSSSYILKIWRKKVNFSSKSFLTYCEKSDLYTTLKWPCQFNTSNNRRGGRPNNT